MGASDWYMVELFPPSLFRGFLALGGRVFLRRDPLDLVEHPGEPSGGIKPAPLRDFRHAQAAVS